MITRSLRTLRIALPIALGLLAGGSAFAAGSSSSAGAGGLPPIVQLQPAAYGTFMTKAGAAIAVNFTASGTPTAGKGEVVYFDMGEYDYFTGNVTSYCEAGNRAYFTGIVTDTNEPQGAVTYFSFSVEDNAGNGDAVRVGLQPNFLTCAQWAAQSANQWPAVVLEGRVHVVQGGQVVLPPSGE